MKKYAFIFLVLLLIGLGLSIQFFTQEEKLDETVFLQTTESIRNLQTLDKNLLLLLNQSRFNTQFDHEQLSDVNYQISEEFDNLRYEALFEEIEQSPALSQAVANFEEQFGSREELLDSYIDGNTAIAESLVKVQSLTDELQIDEQITAQAELAASFITNKTALFALALGGEFSSALTVIEPTSELSQETADALKDYQSSIGLINELRPSTVDAYGRLSELETGALLDDIEQHYVDHHTQAIDGSNNLRNALIGYGILLLGALVFFGIQIRRNYLSLEQQVADRTDEIKTAYDDLQESQEQLIQSEKMASLGQMVAGVAHEINTPLGYVTSNVDTLNLNLSDLTKVMMDLQILMGSVQKRDRDNREITANLMRTLKSYRNFEVPELVSESNQLLSDGAYGLSEISKLVTSLKDFARLDRQNSEQVDVHECVNSSLTIASNHIRENNVNVVREFGELPRIACFPSKLNQLFLNIITNACQAMGDTGGNLTVRTTHNDNTVRIDFQDQGSGMDEETQQKMFDPFFTSKDIGKGTGLGMSIAYKIIEAHGGTIAVDSSLGEGTTLSVVLPTKLDR